MNNNTQNNSAVYRRVEAVIVRGGRYLVEKLGNPSYPQNLGKVRCIGGGPEPGETPRETILREIREEYAIDITLLNIAEPVDCEDPEVCRFRVDLFADYEGRRCLDDDGTVLVFVDELPAPCELRSV